MRVGPQDVRQVATLSTGERIRSARRARGMSRPVLAGLVGRSPDWLKKIETGVRPLNSLPLLVQLARVLNLDDVSELTGDDYSAPVEAWQGEVHHVVPAIRRALADSAFEMLGDAVAPALSAEELALRVRRSWQVWHRSTRQRSEIGAALPELIRQAHTSVRAAEGEQRRRCRAATGDLYRLVQRLLAHIREPELHALAVERGRAFSEDADTPLALAEAAWASAVGLCAAGHYDDAVALADRGADALVRAYRGGPTASAWGTLGALQLEAAAAHGLAGRDGDTYRYLDAAAVTAGRMPCQAWHLPSAFDRSTSRSWRSS
ncbi:helix-turn-helix domain-containing protein [Pseudonocardia kunmingensis]|uniref:helix-turn-helix domain-containing protein n=1 Tax=Pseudonocardia kunmingensis TaxID=630975 RepID=UPI001154C36A|nr:helix-turn-helix domain-containing protein [Pseudonocardia kunmingensis]